MLWLITISFNFDNSTLFKITGCLEKKIFSNLSRLTFELSFEIYGAASVGVRVRVRVRVSSSAFTDHILSRPVVCALSPF